MLEAISWNHYFTTLAIGLTAYYLTVLRWYYPEELRKLIPGQSLPSKPDPLREKNSELDRAEEHQSSPFEELELAVEELQGILASAGTLTDKPTLLKQLGQSLVNHPGLQEPAYRIAIHHFLMENIPKTCRLTVSQQELEVLWQS